MNNKHQGMTYKEWDARRKGMSWKEQTKRDIDTLVLCCKNFDELAATLEERGYTMKYGAYTSILAPGAKRFTRLKTLGEDYTIDGIKSRIEWRDDLGNASRDDSYNKGGTLTICFAGIIAELAKRITDGTKKENKREEKLPYLPHNDRDVHQLGAQLALINKLNIHSIGEVEAKMGETQAAYDSLVKEMNTITQEQHQIDDLLTQYNNLRELDDKPHKSLAEKMKLSLAQKSLARHGIGSLEDARKLELQKQECDYRIAELKREMEVKTNLISAFKEISDTYNGISKGDYISNLIKSEEELEAQHRASAQDRSAPKHDTPAPKPSVHDVAPKLEQQESAPVKPEPKQDEPAQKPITKTTSRGRKH